VVCFVHATLEKWSL